LVAPASLPPFSIKPRITRGLVVLDTPFIAPYRTRDDEVEILAVFHGARQWPEKLD